MSKLADEKRAVFNRLAARFENCDVGGDPPLRILLLERTTDESVATVTSVSGLEPFETLDHGQQQYIAAASNNQFKTNSFQKWHGLAKSAGDEFKRALLLSSAESKSPKIVNFPDGVIGWLIALAWAYQGGYVSSPIQIGYVEHEKWLLASQFQQDASKHHFMALQCNSSDDLSESENYKQMANANSQKYQETWKEVLNAGIEYYFEDVVTASALWATWLANNDSPYGDLKLSPFVKHNVVVNTSRTSGGITLSMNRQSQTSKTNSNNQLNGQNTSSNPPKHKAVRKVNGKKSKPMSDIAFEFLLLWHRYDSDHFTNEPIPPYEEYVKWMKENARNTPIPSDSTVCRMLKDNFGSKKQYERHCVDKTIEALLSVAAREGSKVLQKYTRERTSDADADSNDSD